MQIDSFAKSMHGNEDVSDFRVPFSDFSDFQIFQMHHNKA